MELVKIHPYADGNGRLARMLVQAVLIEEGWPLLPWEILFNHRRIAYVEAVERSIATDDLQPFLHFLTATCAHAIKLGICMAKTLKRERGQLIEALVAGDLTPREAQILADWSLVHVLTPDALPQGVSYGPVYREIKLAATGLLDEVCYDGGTCMSSPVARSLLAFKCW
jgi:hypothetical protein